MAMKYWFWRYLQDYKEDKQCLLRWHRELLHFLSEREKFIKDYCDQDIQDYLEWTDPHNPLSDISICTVMLEDARREVLFTYEVDERQFYSWRYERIED